MDSDPWAFSLVFLDVAPVSCAAPNTSGHKSAPISKNLSSNSTRFRLIEPDRCAPARRRAQHHQEW